MRERVDTCRLAPACGRAAARLSGLTLLGLLLCGRLVPQTASLGPSVVPPTAKLVLRIEPQVDLLAALRGTMTLRPLAGDGEPLSVPLAASGPTDVALPPASRWEVRIDIPKVWVRSGEVALGGAGSETVLRLPAWPWGRLQGRLKLPAPHGKMPKEVTVTTLSPPARLQKPDTPQGMIPCPVEASGRFSCDLPTATYDLVVTVGGMTPLYRQGVPVVAARPADLGTLTLRQGASVAGWVAVEGGRISKDGCRARLRPLILGQSDLKTRDRLNQASRVARVRGDGFFQITGVAPGTYALEVEQPGAARALVSQVEVWPGAETFLREPIVLHRPFRVEVRITPEIDWLGQPWRVQVFRDGSQTGESGLGALYSGEASAEGIVTLPNQAPGSFSIFIDDSRGNRLSWQKSVPILGPEDAVKTVEIELITLSGTLRLGQEPLAATLWFGGWYGASRVEIESDAQGKFLGVLPRQGGWRVGVVASDPALHAEVWARVEADRDGRAEVDLRLPDTRLFGRVVDEKGSPRAGAEVTLQQGSLPVYLESDEAGAFETRGLAAEPLVASAQASGGDRPETSSPMYLALAEGQSTGPIELRLRKTKTYSGTLVSGRGPVIGAEVFVAPLSPKTATGADNPRSDLTGKFEAQIDGSAEQVLLAVRAPGYPLQIFSAPASQSGAFTLTPGGGTVFLENPSGQAVDPDAAPTTRVVLFQNRLLVPPPILTQWLFGHGVQSGQVLEKWEIPELAPGTYQACRIPLKVFADWLAAGTGPIPEYCVEGGLAAGASLTLRPPLPGASTERPTR